MRIIRTQYRTGASLIVETGSTSVSVRSSSSSRKTISPGARSRMNRFFDQIDWDLSAEEREARRKAKKEHRKAKRRLKKLLEAARSGDAKRRVEARATIIDLLKNGGAI